MTEGVRKALLFVQSAAQDDGCRWLTGEGISDSSEVAEPDASCSVICGQQATPVTAFVDVQLSKARSAQITGWTGESADAGASQNCAGMQGVVTHH